MFARNIKNIKTLKSHILEKTLLLSIICSKCDSKDEKIFKEKELIEILKILNLTNNIVPKDMPEEKIGQKFRLKEIGKTRNDFNKEIKQNELLSKTHKKICKILIYIKHLLILA